MDSWPEKEAEARFGEMLERCLMEGPQIVTREGTGTAVLMPIADWERFKMSGKLSLEDWLKTDFARGDIPIAKRKPSRHRPILAFDD